MKLHPFTSSSQVGTICCRLEKKDDQNVLYLMTMGVLAVSLRFFCVQRTLPYPAILSQPYRSRKLGSQSLELILTAASAHTRPKIDKVYLHVQVSNHEAKKFYERHGFNEVEIHKDYYKKITPHDAWVLERAIP
jgi:N-alpha-acetyltransferase 50